MKRIFSLILALLILVSLVSCSKKPAGEQKKTEAPVDPASLSAAEFYQSAANQNKDLKSVYYKTLVRLNDIEQFTIETRRIRDGYEDYHYSRKGREEIVLLDAMAYVSGDLGNFSAPATARSFDRYLEEFVFPVCGFDSASFFEAKREGNTVSYTVTAKEVFSLYDKVLSRDEFTPRTLEGVCTISDEGIITRETISLEGTGRDGTEAKLVLETNLEAKLDSGIAITLPAEAENFVSLADVSLPEKIVKATESLSGVSELQATFVSSNAVKIGEKTYALYEDVTVYQKENEGYLSRQSLKQIPGAGETSLFYQCREKDGKKSENQYDLLSGNLLLEKSGSGEISALEELKNILPNISDFATLVMEEDVNGYSISFSLSEEGAEKVFKTLCATLPECGKTQKDFVAGECTGTLSVSKETGVLTALAYGVKGTLHEGEETDLLEGRYSFFLDGTENIVVPEMQTPTATTPGMEPEAE